MGLPSWLRLGKDNTLYLLGEVTETKKREQGKDSAAAIDTVAVAVDGAAGADHSVHKAHPVTTLTTAYPARCDPISSAAGTAAGRSGTAAADGPAEGAGAAGRDSGAATAKRVVAGTADTAGSSAVPVTLMIVKSPVVYPDGGVERSVASAVAAVEFAVGDGHHSYRSLARCLLG